MEGWKNALMLAAGGAAAVGALDIVRALRRGMRASGAAAAILDFLSAAAAVAVIWAALLIFAAGELRMCFVLCMCCGAVIYIFTVRETIFRLFWFLFEKIFKFLSFILKILLTPAHFLYKIVYVGKFSKSKSGDDMSVQKNRQISR